MKAAQWWRQTPESWRTHGEIERGEMLAVWREIQLRESMASKVARDVSEEEGKKGKRADTAGPDPYAAFFGEV